jgi:D-psicose/D-tagatose/L-ribulose 3-epimerase
MKPQNYELKRIALVEKFKAKMASAPPSRDERIKLSWSNWGFGMEPLKKTAQRLEKNGIRWIELHGNRYGDDLGYRSAQVREILGACAIQVAGVCGMFGPENDLSSNSGAVRQRAIDYIRRQLDLCHETGGSYLLVVPGAVGRPVPYDDSEFERSVETLRLVAEDFVKAGIRGAVEPIRSAEVSFIHTVQDAQRYLAAVDHPGVSQINGDVYHMQVEENNIPDALLDAGAQLINLHLADSNRGALGNGCLDVDAIMMALYLIGYPEGLRFATPEPLGPGGSPYPAMFGKPDSAVLDALVAQTAAYWRQREEELLSFLPPGPRA